MTTGFALGPIPDQLTRICYSYMGLKTLANLASTSKRFSLLTHPYSSDLAKIQAVANRCGRDLGFGIAYTSYPNGYFTIHNPRCVSWRESEIDHIQLLPDQTILQDASYLGSCAHYLFTSETQKNKNIHIRNTKGDILCTIEAKYPQAAIYFAPSPEREQVTVTTSFDLNITVWEITQTKAAQKVIEHSVADLAKNAEYSRMTESYQFGNLLVGSIRHSREFLHLLFTFDLSHPELPPKKLPHPKNQLFDTITKNSDHLFGLTNNPAYVVAYQIANGRANVLWETDLKIFGVDRAWLRFANDRWLVCEYKKASKQSNRDILVLDAKTGQKRGDFIPNPEDHPSSFTIWGNDILVAQAFDKSGHVLKRKNKALMWQLPLGEPLFVLEQEGCDYLFDEFTDKEQLILLYKQKETGLVRGVSWTSAAPSPTSPPSFLESAYSCFASLFSCFTNIWRWLLNQFSL